MNQRFQNAEIRLVSERYAENELYKAVCTIGHQLESELTEFGLCPEECFIETLEFLSAIAEKGEDILSEIEDYWIRKSNDYRRLARQVERVNEEEIRKVVGIVFGFTILAIDSSRHPFYRRKLSEQLTYAIANHQFKGWPTTLDRIFSVPLPDGWFDAFIDEEIPKVSPSSARAYKATKQKKASEKKLNGKPKTLRYLTHGNNGVLMKQGERLKFVFEKWNKWGWIDSETTTDDFDAFFEGEPRHCNITWKANSTVLSILMRELLEQPFIAKQKRQSASSMVKEQFGLTPNFDSNRLSDDDKLRIDVTVYLLGIDNPLPLRKGGYDDDYDTTDAAFQAVLLGQLRLTKGI